MAATSRIKNALCASALLPDYLIFARHMADFGHVQKGRLSSYLDANKDTVFGKEHGFRTITSIEEYQRKVPVREYADFTPYMDRISNGERAVLTKEPVTLLEPTGGTSSGSKLIPYTRSLKREFQKAVHPWIFDLYMNIQGLTAGRCYWSITPVTAGNEHTEGGIPIGFEDDSEYLGFAGRFLRSTLCVPSEVKDLHDINNFRYATAFFLLAASDLVLISVWNPTFLILLLEYIDHHHEQLLRDIFDGRIRLPVSGEEDFSYTPIHRLPARARQLEAVFQGAFTHRYTEIWKHLRVISCWSDGASRFHAQRISDMFPGVYLQPKGLLATEGIVSIPLENAKGSVVAYQSHFLEFLPDPEETPRLLHQLDKGQVYTVVMTTGGGLYRYNLKDKILVIGTHRGLPIVAFHGRSSVSDIVGEKLEEAHVQRVIEGVLTKYELHLNFVLFAPEMNSSGGYYTLFVEPRSPLNHALTDKVMKDVDRGLLENFHYKYARDIGQLREPELFIVNKGEGQKTFLRRCSESGQRLGDIKPALLDRRTGWKLYFASS